MKLVLKLNFQYCREESLELHNASLAQQQQLQYYQKRQHQYQKQGRRHVLILQEPQLTVLELAKTVTIKQGLNGQTQGSTTMVMAR